MMPVILYIIVTMLNADKKIECVAATLSMLTGECTFTEKGDEK